MKDAVRRLRALGLFADFDDRAFERLLLDARELTCEPGEIIVEEGAPGDALYLLLEGDVEIFKRRLGDGERILDRCTAGECFGEQALLPGRAGVRTASVRAVGRTRLCRIDKGPFQELLADDHPLKERLLQVGDRRLLENLAAESRLFRALRLGAEPVEERRFPKGGVIFRQGDPADGLYLILEGRVAIHDEGGDAPTLLTTLGPGQCFGELGLLTQGARAATASAAEDCRVMVVPAARYQAGLAESAELAELFQTLRRIYKLPRRGRLVQSAGAFRGLEAMTSLYELEDGRRVVVSRVVGQEIYNADEVFAPAPEPAITSLRFVDDGEQVRRELRIAGGRLVGLTVHGPWSLLAELQGRLLDQAPFGPELYARFESTGRLGFEEGPLDHRLLCACVQVERSAIVQAIQRGSTRLVELQERLGCGTVCGGCLPAIRQLLGDERWAPVRIVDERQLTRDVRRFQLRPLGGPPAKALPGQHVVLSGLVDGEWVRRPYTLTSACSEPEHYEILVKREPQGLFSGWLFDQAGEDALLRISAPQGDFCWRPNRAPAVCLVAGIGITPALAMLRSRRREGWREPLHIDLSVRTDEDLLCRDELQAAAAGDEGVSVECRVTSRRGRIRQPDVAALQARFPDGEYFLCGPPAYMDAVGAMLRRAGVEAAKIHRESFTPAAMKTPPQPTPPDAGAPRKPQGLTGLLRAFIRRL